MPCSRITTKVCVFQGLMRGSGSHQSLKKCGNQWNIQHNSCVYDGIDTDTHTLTVNASSRQANGVTESSQGSQL